MSVKETLDCLQDHQKLPVMLTLIGVTTEPCYLKELVENLDKLASTDRLTALQCAYARTTCIKDTRPTFGDDRGYARKELLLRIEGKIAIDTPSHDTVKAYDLTECADVQKAIMRKCAILPEEQRTTFTLGLVAKAIARRDASYFDYDVLYNVFEELKVLTQQDRAKIYQQILDVRRISYPYSRCIGSLDFPADLVKLMADRVRLCAVEAQVELVQTMVDNTYPNGLKRTVIDSIMDQRDKFAKSIRGEVRKILLKHVGGSQHELFETRTLVGRRHHAGRDKIILMPAIGAVAVDDTLPTRRSLRGASL